MDYEVLQFTYIDEIFIVSWLRLIHYSVISKDILPIKSSFVLAVRTRFVTTRSSVGFVRKKGPNNIIYRAWV